MISAKGGLLDAKALGTDSHLSRRRSSATGGVRRAAASTTEGTRKSLGHGRRSG